MTDTPDDPPANLDAARRERIKSALAAERKITPPGEELAARGGENDRRRAGSSPGSAAASKGKTPFDAPRPTASNDPNQQIPAWNNDTSAVKALGHQNGVFYGLDDAGQFFGLPREKLVHATWRSVFLSSISQLYAKFGRWKLTEDGWQLIGWRPEKVSESFIVACAAEGVIDPDRMVRGPGAWLDEVGNLILHCGDAILLKRAPAIDDPGEVVELPPGRHGGKIYPRAPRLPRPFPDRVPADRSPAHELLTQLQTWQWVRGDLDAMLLLGWIGAAMVGGALKWRPVIWITGAKGTGKSTLWDMVQLQIGELIAASDTSAPGLWQTLRVSTRAVAVDELESEQDNRRQNNVVKLARLAASGGKIIRGGQDHQPVEFEARSCFAFLSINVPPLTSQDRSRMAILELRDLLKGEGAPRPPSFNAEKTAEIGAMLRRRMVDGWWQLDRIIGTYRAALEKQGHSSRGCDVFGTLLGCADLLLHDLDMPDREGFDVDAIAAKLNVAVIAETSDDLSDDRAMLAHLLSQTVDPFPGGTRKALFEYIVEAIAPVRSDELQLQQEERLASERSAGRALSLHGLNLVNADGKTKLARTHLALAYQHPALLAIFSHTHWAGRAGSMGPWIQAARRLPGAVNAPSTIRFVGGPQRAVLIPLEVVLGRPLPRPTSGDQEERHGGRHVDRHGEGVEGPNEISGRDEVTT